MHAADFSFEKDPLAYIDDQPIQKCNRPSVVHTTYMPSSAKATNFELTTTGGSNRRHRRWLGRVLFQLVMHQHDWSIVFPEDRLQNTSRGKIPVTRLQLPRAGRLGYEAARRLRWPANTTCC